MAGLQADAVALHAVAGLADPIGDGDDELVPVAAAGDGDGAGGVRIFADIGEEVLKDPPEVAQVHPQGARNGVRTGLHLKSPLGQVHDVLQNHLLQQCCRVEVLRSLIRGGLAEDQEEAEELIGQGFEPLGVVLADVEIRAPLLRAQGIVG